MKKRLFYAVLLVTSIVCAQQSQDSIRSQQLDEVVISDSKFKLKREHSGKTVIKITAEELSKNQGKTIAEVINAQSGIEINGSRSYAGQNLSYFIRGGNNRQVLVMIDGVQISDPSQIANDYDLRLIDINQVESIEIVKGASSTLYGNNAATAVINITTKKGSKKPIEANFSTQIGSNQSANDQKYDIADFNNSVSVNGTIKKINYLASFLHQYTDGLSAANNGTEKDAFSRINVNTKLGYQVSDKVSIDFYANHTKLKADFDNSFPLEDADFVSRSEQNRVGTSLKYNYNTKGSFNLNTSYQAISRDIMSNFPNTFKGDGLVVDAFNKYKLKDNLYTILGVNYINNKTNFDQEREINMIDPYANVVWISDFGLNVNAGVRLNNHNEYGSHMTYSINPSYTYKFKNNYAKILSSYSTSYIAPSLAQLFGPFGPNPDLEPEENTTLEVGLEFKWNNVLKVSSVYFDRKEENFIDYVITDFITFDGQYLNTDQDFEVNGVEVEVVYKPTNNVHVNANYTFTERKDQVALRIPKHKANANVYYTFKDQSTATLNYQFVGTREDTNFSTFTNENLSSFSLVNVGYQRNIIKDRLNASINVFNVFDEEYTEVIGFTTRGRNIKLGVNLQF